MRKVMRGIGNIFLSLIMVAAMFPTPTYADNNYTGGGTGDEGYGTGVWRANWNEKQLGVRVSIVDHEGNIVLEDGETGKPYVVDILFSQPSGLSTNNILYMKGNKFQDYTGVEGQGVKAIPVWTFNKWINNAIDSNTALSHLKKLDDGFTSSSKNYKGLPVPIINKGGSWKGNGQEVKEFFISGSIGVFNSGSSGPSYNADDLYTPSSSSGSSWGSGSSSSKPSSGGSSSNAGSTQGASKKIKTPYGLVTQAWLNQHYSQVNGNSVTQLKNSGYITSSEKSAILTRANSVYNKIMTKFRNRVSKIPLSGSTAKIPSSVSFVDCISGGQLLLLKDYYSGKVTYEAMRVNNIKLNEMAAIASSYYSKVYMAVTANVSSNAKKAMVNNYRNSLYIVLQGYAKSLEVTNGNFLEYTQIPLIRYEMPLITETSSLDALVKGLRELADVYSEELEAAKTDADKAKVKEKYNQNYISLLKLKYKENYLVFQGVLGSDINSLLTMSKENLESKVSDADKKVEESKQQIKDAINNATAHDKEFMESNQIDADQIVADATKDVDKSKESLGLGGLNDQVIFTSDTVKLVLERMVAVNQQSGRPDITYDVLLSKITGNTESEKLSAAAVEINKIGLQAWLDATFDFSVKASFDDQDLFSMDGYLPALLDMRKEKNGDYIFNVSLSDEKLEDYKSRLEISKDKNDYPSRRFLYGEYAVILEPLYWYKPVSTLSGQWNSDGGAYSSGRRLYRCKVNILGTPTNFAQWMNEGNNHYKTEAGHTDLTKSMAVSMYIDEEVGYFNAGAISALSMPADDFTRQNVYNKNMISKIDVGIDSKWFGYSWHFAGPDVIGSQTSGIPTWNSTVQSPGPAPDPSPLPDPSKNDDGTPVKNDEYPNGVPNKHFTIVKYYEDRDFSSDPTVPTITRYGPTIRKNTPNTIRIIDEPVYKVEDWYITSTEELPNENDDSEDYYVRKDGDSGKTRQSTSSSLKTTVELDKENKNDNPKDTNDKDEAEKVLYVLLVKSNKQSQKPSNVIIQESQVTKAIHTDSDNISGANWGSYNFGFSIGGFRTSAKWYCSAYRCSGHSHSLTLTSGSADKKLEFIFEGLHSITFGSGVEIGFGKSSYFEPSVSTNGGVHKKEVTSTSNNEYTFISDGNSSNGVDYTTVLWRYADIPTLPTYKKADIISKYSQQSWDAPASILPNNQTTPSNKRTNNGSKQYNLAIEFGVNQTKSDLKATVACSAGHRGCPHKNTKQVELLTGGSWSLPFNTGVLVKTYRGNATLKSLADEPFASLTEKHVTKASGTPHFSYTTVQGKQTIEFFPYIKMTYQTNSLSLLKLEEKAVNSNTRFDTYVFSEQKSKILPSDAIEVGWSNPNEKSSLNLTSQQWSLHQKAITGSDGWQGRNQVLPGGAIYQLNTGKNETNVKIVSYQTVVDGETRAYLSSALTGDEYTEDAVKREHTNFVTTAKDVLENLRIVQWVNDNTKSTTAWPSDWNETTRGSVCVRGGGISLSTLNGLNNKSNSESKYYMQKSDFGQPASEGDLDIVYENQVTTVFKIFTDTEGNVWMASAQAQTDDVQSLVDTLKDVNADVTPATANVQLLANKSVKWQDINSKLTGDAKQLDDRTKAITNVVKSLERNTGNDPTASWASKDGKWYNEAFDGLYVVRQATTLQVGLKDPAKRTAALDPALCPPNSGQSDLYSKAFLSQFCMNDKSDAAVAQGKESQYLGTFKGIDIKLPDMQGLYQSRKFYIPNANVQDLN